MRSDSFALHWKGRCRKDSGSILSPRLGRENYLAQGTTPLWKGWKLACRI